VVNYHRLILALTDEELEHFTEDWINAKKKSFYEITSFAGSSDMGRDVVAFLSSKKHEGEWYNYQCKQYRKNLPTNTALLEIGKILYFSYLGNFTPPQKYYFVAPRGINRNLENLIYKPIEFKKRLINDWDKVCSKEIIDGKSIILEKELFAFVSEYDFSRIERIRMNEILLDPDITPVLFKWFGKDPGPAPEGVVPKEVSLKESHYLSELISAYSEREKKEYHTIEDFSGNKNYLEHLKIQRIRFYDADAFKRFYRDNTENEIIDNFEKEVFHGVIDKCYEPYHDTLEKINSIMTHAGIIQTTGCLAKHTPISVKQGVCHHFVNDGKLKWKN